MANLSKSGYLPDLPVVLIGELIDRYGEPGRHYHSMGHIKSLLRQLHRSLDIAKQPQLIEAAIWFHDAIYDTHRHDNEDRSAELARTQLSALGWPIDAVDAVGEMILATKKHEVAGIRSANTSDVELFLDLDLSILGQSKGVYERYSKAIRAEYGWVDDETYRVGRLRVLNAFVKRPVIYFTERWRGILEETARRNVQSEIDALKAAS